MCQHVAGCSIDVNLRAGHAVVGEEEPETEDGLGEDVKNSVGNDLSVEANKAATVSNTPDAALVSTSQAERTATYIG